MLALSWKEPFATLMLHGKIETRTWSTNYRGLVLICASKTPYNNKQLINIVGRDYSIISLGNTLGKAIAIGELVDCRKMKPEDEDLCFVKYRPDLFCHVYKNVRAIKPIPFKGKQRWSKLDDEFINKIQKIKA